MQEPIAPVLPIGTVVARRELRSSAGGPVGVLVGAPVHVGGGWDWACPYRIEGLGEPVTGQAHGIDALQALQLVSTAIRAALEESGASLRWHRKDFWQAGFPREVEAFGIPELEKALLDFLGDATALWFAEHTGRGRGGRTRPGRATAASAAPSAAGVAASARRTRKGGSVYQLKVTLRGIRPPIWRRLEVRSDLTLGRLHEVLQVAMGWTDSHLHAFLADGVEYGVPDPEWGTHVKSEARVRLDRVLRAPKERLVYQYDFGDGWEHVVTLEKVLPFDPERHRDPVVTGGRRACPPEDCGGVPGYQQMLAVLADPDDPDHEDMSVWVGDEFDPAAFDLEEANLFLRGG